MNKNLGHGNTRVNGRCIREDGISSNLFRSPRDVESWESGFEMLPHRVPSGNNSPLSGFVEGFLNGVFVDLAKIGPEFSKSMG